MTPAASWSPADYYVASRAARRMGEAMLAQQQMQGVLDAADAGAVRCIEPAAPVQSPLPPGGGLALQAFDGDGANHMQGARRPRKEVTP